MLTELVACRNWTVFNVCRPDLATYRKKTWNALGKKQDSPEQQLINLRSEAAKMTNSYFIKRGEKVHGPFSESQLRAGLKSNKLSSQDLVSGTRTGPWREINSEFAAKQQTSSPNLEEDILGWINEGTGNPAARDLKQDTLRQHADQVYDSTYLQPSPEQQQKEKKALAPAEQNTKGTTAASEKQADPVLLREVSSWEPYWWFLPNQPKPMRCPHCNSHLRFAKEAYLKELPCPACNRLIFFPKPNFDAILSQVLIVLVPFGIYLLWLCTDFFEVIIRNK